MEDRLLEAMLTDLDARLRKLESNAPASNGRKLERAAKVIRKLLRNGPLDSAALERRTMRKARVSIQTYKAARKLCGVRSRRAKAGHWESWIPSD